MKIITGRTILFFQSSYFLMLLLKVHILENVMKKKRTFGLFETWRFRISIYKAEDILRYFYYFEYFRDKNGKEKFFF